MRRVMLREMLRQVLRLILRWLLRSMPTDVLREMPTLVPTVVLRMLPRMVTTVLLPVLRTLLLRQVPTTFANRGAKRMLTTVRTVLLTLLRTIHDHGHDREPSMPGSCIRSGRATKGDEVKHLENGFAPRHHLLTKSLWKKRGQNRSGKKRQKAATNLPQYDAFCRWSFAAFCRR